MTTGPIFTGEDWALDMPMSDEQKFIFDLKGWLLIPGVLNDAEIATVKEHVIRLKQDYPDENYMPGRWEMPSQALFDHPVVAGVLREIVGPDRNESCYGFRCESSVPRVRSTDFEGLDPHGGSGIGALAYACRGSEIYSGLTRVVWELNPIDEGDGGTLLMSGSHKANFGVHASHTVMNSPLFETYSCPAGSVLFFTESLCHAGPLWTNSERKRISVFNCYSSDIAQYHKTNLTFDVVARMPPKRQTLFRGVWSSDFSRGRSNNYADAENTAQ